MIILLIWVVVLIVVLVQYFKQKYSYFDQYGIKYIKPTPPLGNMHRVLFRYEHVTDDILRLYKSFPGERFVGRFEFVRPGIVIRDLDLIKKVAVKDFEHFVDHRDFSGDTFFSRTLFMMKGQEWKDMRSTLSPAFTSSKIRHMVPFMVEVGDQMIQSLKQRIEASQDGYIDIDTKDLAARYANDVIASCAFGLKVDSLAEENNEFYTMGKALSKFSFRQLVMFFLIALSPKKVVEYFNWDLVSPAMRNFFTSLVLDTMKEREARHIIRPDMIHLLMQVKKGKLTHDDVKANDEAAGFATVEESSIGKKEIKRVWEDRDLVAQAMLFFAAGFDTVSTGMTFTLYELALNPDVQERLAQEIREHDDKNGGKFDFNSIQTMKYMDMVVSEALRRWPPGMAVDRVCNKDYDLGKPNETAPKNYILKKGSVIIIPTYAFHYDPEYFPEPQKFDPERFSDENKHKINPIAYMPFGIGPRNCIGSRFALCEVKVMTYQILRHFEVSPCEKTCIPAKLARDKFTLVLQGGHSLRFKLRK